MSSRTSAGASTLVSGSLHGGSPEVDGGVGTYCCPLGEGTLLGLPGPGPDVEVTRPVDPQIQSLLDAMAALDAPPIEQQTPEEVRAAFRIFGAADAGGPEVGSVTDQVIIGPDSDLTLRVYLPDGVTPGGSHAGSAPGVLVWFHGGGWTIGELDTADHVCRLLCQRSGAAVVSVDYRLAPEHPYPAAFQDAWAATEWVAANGAVIGIDASRMAVGGDSAGGNLAALVALRARGVGEPTLRHQLLVYPGIDLTMSHPSIVENGEGYFLTRASMEWFEDQYLGQAREHGDPRDPEVSPHFAADLSGLAPAHVITAEFDPLRDEGDAYATALSKAGVAVDHDTNPGMIHGFFQMDAITAAADAAVTRAADRVRAALS
ncbi:MAG: alpha/beta hydrolase [Acidimicrobiales bacterium]